MSAKEGTSKTKVAVGGFIGPIPFGFGNDKQLVWFIAILSLLALDIKLFLCSIFKSLYKVQNTFLKAVG